MLNMIASRQQAMLAVFRNFLRKEGNWLGLPSNFVARPVGARCSSWRILYRSSSVVGLGGVTKGGGGLVKGEGVKSFESCWKQRKMNR